MEVPGEFHSSQDDASIEEILQKESASIKLARKWISNKDVSILEPAQFALQYLFIYF